MTQSLLLPTNAAAAESRWAAAGDVEGPLLAEGGGEVDLDAWIRANMADAGLRRRRAATLQAGLLTMYTLLKHSIFVMDDQAAGAHLICAL